MATFIGRDVELARLASIPRGVLVTLRGTGGVGKTTLAREHAARVRAAGRAVAWADLAPARTLRDVVAAIARALDVALGANDADVGALARAATRRGSMRTRTPPRSWRRRASLRATWRSRAST